jgi:transcriptional regulator GlxA family with amidase domain
MRNERLVPLLIDVRRELDQDIDLDSLARKFGTSSFHFHRTFAANNSRRSSGRSSRLAGRPLKKTRSPPVGSVAR